MRNGFAAFSVALAADRNPKPNAPPVAAETLMKFLRVVDLMQS
jgi:hypothetical protein